MSRKKSAKFRRGAVAHFVIFFIFLTEDQGDDKKITAAATEAPQTGRYAVRLKYPRAAAAPSPAIPRTAVSADRTFLDFLLHSIFSILYSLYNFFCIGGHRIHGSLVCKTIVCQDFLSVCEFRPDPFLCLGIFDQSIDLGPHILVGGELVLVFRAGDLRFNIPDLSEKRGEFRLASGISPASSERFWLRRNAVAFVIFKEILPVVFMLAI